MFATFILSFRESNQNIFMKSMPPTPEVVNKLAASLQRCALFQGIEPKLLTEIAAKAKLIQVDPGEFLTREGQSADAFYVFLNGKAAALIRQDKTKEEAEIAQLGPGDTAGEIALLLSQPYAASVKATSRVVAARYDAKFFEKMVQEMPAFGLVLAKAIANRFQSLIRMIPVPEYSSEEGIPSEQAFRLLPIDFIKRHRVLPIKKEGNNLILGFMDEPSSSVLQSVRSFLTGIEIRPVRINSDLFESMMRTHSGEPDKPKTEIKSEKKKTISADTSIAAPLSLERLLKSMISEGASDLHLSAGHHPRWRIDGQLVEIVRRSVVGFQRRFAATGAFD